MNEKVQQLKDFMHEVNARLPPKQPQKQDYMLSHQTYPLETNSVQMWTFIEVATKEVVAQAPQPRA